MQPSEFLKPGLIVMSAWLMAASQEINGPPGKAFSFAITLIVVAFLAMQPDFGQACLVLFGWGVMYFVAGAPFVLLIGMAASVVLVGTFAYNNSEHFARRIDGFLNPEVDPTTQLGYATERDPEGGFFGVGVGEGQVKWSLPDAHTDFIIAVAAEEYGLILVLVIILLYMAIIVRSLLRLIRERDPFIRLAGTGLACMLRRAGDDQHGCGGAAAAGQGHDAAVRQLRRLVADRGRHRGGHAAGLYPDAAAGRNRRYPDQAGA